MQWSVADGVGGGAVGGAGGVGPYCLCGALQCYSSSMIEDSGGSNYGSCPSSCLPVCQGEPRIDKLINVKTNMIMQ